MKSGVCAVRYSCESGCCIFSWPAGRQGPQASTYEFLEFAHGAVARQRSAGLRGLAKGGDVPWIVGLPEESPPRLRGRLESGGTD